MKNLLLSALFALGVITGMPLTAYAQNIQFVPPVTTESGEPVEVEDNALNYFASSAEKRKAMEAKKAAAPEGHVPASELEYLPEELELGGNAKLKIEGGKIISHSNTSERTYSYCEDYVARGEAVPDGCIQKNGTEPPMSTDAPHEQTIADAPPTSRQPQTLDAQLQAKRQTAPEPVSVKSGTGHIGNTAVIDKARGSKTNIISNTDTGVKLDY